MTAATTATLSNAFALVDPSQVRARWAARDPRVAAMKPASWRDPINTLVLDLDLAAAGVTIQDVEEAVLHYTATEAAITRYPAIWGRAGETFGDPLPAFLVLAPGYRAGPAGP